MPRVGCANSQAFLWLELTARSLSSTVPAHKSNAVTEGAVMEINFGALPGSEPGTLCTTVKDLNPCATLLLTDFVYSIESQIMEGYSFFFSVVWESGHM